MKRWAALAAVGVISGCGDGGAGSAAGQKPTPALNVSIKVGRPTLQYGQAQTFPVELTNNGNRDFGWLEAECQFRRSDGSLIQAGQVLVDNFRSGSTRVEQITFMTPEQGVLSCVAVSDF
nr:hypothetical protein [Brevundimonas naejangsanensis]